MAYNRAQEPQLHVKGSKYIVVLPSPLVGSFFAPAVKKISTCLGELRRNKSLAGLKYVFLVGGFSASPLIQAAARAELHGEGCVVLAALRPEVAIVRGAVPFANSAKTFVTRKARLTYLVRREDDHCLRRHQPRARSSSAAGPARAHREFVDLPQDRR